MSPDSTPRIHTSLHTPTPRTNQQEGDAQADPELASLLQELDNGGGAEVIEAIQEKFLQRTLGGACVNECVCIYVYMCVSVIFVCIY